MRLLVTADLHDHHRHSKPLADELIDPISLAEVHPEANVARGHFGAFFPRFTALAPAGTIAAFTATGALGATLTALTPRTL